MTLALVLGGLPLVAQQTPFIYQGRLTAAQVPAEGLFDLRFTLHDAPQEGSQLGEAITNAAAPVVAGNLTAELTLEPAWFDGSPRWLEIAVRPAEGEEPAEFETLSPRQLLGSVPQAMLAQRALEASALTSPLPAELLQGEYANALMFLHPENQLGGDGSGLTGVNADRLEGLSAANFALADHRHADWDGYLLGQEPLPSEFWSANSNQLSAVLPEPTPPPTSGGTIWVDAGSGSDETGLRERPDRPFATAGAALRQVQNGDLVWIRPGIYPVEALYYSSDLGEINPELYLKDKTNITILGHGAELVATRYGNMLTIEGCHRVTLKGLTFRGSDTDMGTLNIAAAINHRGTNSYTTIQECSFIDIPDQAISHCWDQLNRPSYHWTIQNNWFHNIGQTNHPGVIGGNGQTLPDGAMVSGRPRRLVFTGNRSTGRNTYGVEFDGGGASQPGNDAEIRQSVITGNVLEGIYWWGVTIVGYGTSPVTDIVISGNTIRFHETDHRSGGLVSLSGAKNIVISGNLFQGPTVAESQKSLRGVVVHNPIGDGRHPSNEHLLICGNQYVGLTYGVVIAPTHGAASITSAVLISGNTFIRQGEASISVAGKGVQVIGNSFFGCGAAAGTTYPHACRVWDMDGAPATGFVFANNTLHDLAGTAGTTRFLRGHSTANPRTALDIRDNRIVRMSGTMPYELSDGTPVLGNSTTLTDGPTINTDVLLGSHFRVLLGGNRILANPANPADGQRVTWELIQDATGGRTITLGAQFALGADISAVDLSTTAYQRDFLTAIYSAAAAKWYVVDFKKGY